MYLKKLSIIQFKNYTSAELQFCSRINCVAGANGEGKTNLLDAIHYLSFCKSYFNPIDSQNILHDTPFFVIQGTWELDGKEEEIYCGQKRNQKKQFKRNKKEYERLADHIGLFPLVMISPSDQDLINEGSETRRKLLDSIISQLDKQYLDVLMAYNKLLAQRNAQLKRMAEQRSFDKEALDIWDEQMVSFGIQIHERRRAFVASFLPLFQHYYSWISEGKEAVGLRYDSDLNDASFEQVLQNNLERDLRMQYSTVGTHKDDLIFELNGYPIKKYGSQGQQKSYLIAIKLAQFELMKKTRKLTPVLLLDDIYDKLDEQRVQKLMTLVSSDQFGQIFITDTNIQRLKSLFDPGILEVFFWQVTGGNVQPVSEQFSIVNGH